MDQHVASPGFFPYVFRSKHYSVLEHDISPTP